MTEISNTMTVDEEIYSCLDLENPKSFFLFAGAGSGKTRSLVEVLKRFQEENVQRLRLSGQKVAIITYTNAACDEIKRRLDFDPTFVVSTIHSFSWELIRPYHNDIREWLKGHLNADISDLEQKQLKGRAGTKTALDREKKIISKKNRLERLNNIKAFTYNPNGDNTSRDSLNHAEVINIAAEFLDKPLMQKIVIRKYPILLIDESQDTQKDLIKAFFTIQSSHSKYFTLGLFGDTMQRIYMDGKLDLGANIPNTWTTPAITLNHRCPQRVITLINKIRSQVDNQIQKPPEETTRDGFVRLFVIHAGDELDKIELESQVAKRMASITGDSSWDDEHKDVKILTLEHHMAARRAGFDGFFTPLYAVGKLKTGLLDGTLSGIPFFAQQILPLIKARHSGDKFAIAQIVRKYSPILKNDALKDSQRPLDEIRKANSAVESLYALWNEGHDPTLIDILKQVTRNGLFRVPDVLVPIASREETPNLTTMPVSENEEPDRDDVIDAWDEALSNPFSQIEAYVDYISDQSRFGTHQGIKGLEFPRVMVILDDSEAHGFLFSYEKLFGAKAPTATDLINESDGKETSIDRTRRLFYVTCSRTKESLAIVAYTNEPAKVKSHVIEHGWFGEAEVIEL